jgi:DNA topoisomerase-2
MSREYCFAINNEIITMVVIRKTTRDNHTRETPSQGKKVIIKKALPNVPDKKLVEIHNDGEDYQRLELADHIYLIPDTYIGSDQQIERESWIYDLEKDCSVPVTITLPQGVERIFLEILPNAGDNALRSMAEGIDPGDIVVTMDSHWVTVRNGGKPIPIRINQKEKMWNPDMIFGTLLTSSNYDTTKKRVGCGRNGYGAKLSNIFSKHFIVEVGDPERGLRYHQEWKNNMKDRSEPIITKGYNGEAFVEVKYLLDFERFGYSAKAGYPEEAFGLFARYVYDYSQNIHITTSFNGKIFEPTPDRKDHARFYFGDVPMIIHYEWPPGAEVITKKNGLQQSKDPLILPTSVLILADTPNNGRCVSFVNGIMTSEGGVHVNEALKAVSKPLLDTINTIKSLGKKKDKEDKEDKKTKLTWKDVKNHISILLVCHLDNPQFGGQMKEKLVKPTPKFHLSDKTLAPISKWGLVLYLMKMMDDKINKLLAKTNGKKRKHIDGGKGRDANLSGGPQSANCMLFIVEGDSAKNYAYIAQGMIPNGPDYIGVLPLQGKPLNVMNAMATDPKKIANNHEISELKKYLGLEDFVDYKDPKNFDRLRYGRLVILADADDDGTHIKSLIILLFKCFYPTLLELGYVQFLRTPLIRILGTNLVFYSQAEFQLWRQQNPDYVIREGQTKYYKGLGSSKKEDIQQDLQDPRYVTCIYDMDNPNFNASEALDLAFNNRRANDRKEWLKNWNYTLEELNIGRLEELPISEFIDKELIVYARTSIRRAIPSLMDGIKEGQRKILWASYLIWGKGKNAKTKKVSGLGAYVVEHLEYHHGEGCLDKTIIGMAQNFVGSNNMNYLYPDGLFGSREEGGKDASAGRYIFTKLEWWFPIVFKKEDMDLLTFREEDGKQIEPNFMLPILPMHVINGAHGVGTGWSSYIPNHDPLDVVNWLKARLRGEELPTLVPWYRGFTGDISIKIKKGNKKYELSNLEDEDEEVEREKPGLTMVTKGRFEHKDGKIIITELPVGLWTLRYHKWLEELVTKKEISDFSWHGDDERIHFEIVGFKDANYKTLRLQKSFGMTNMVLLDKDDRPNKYKSIQEIMETFYQYRLPYFAERRKRVIAKYEEEMLRLDAKARYIQAIKDKKIDLNADNQEIEDKLAELQIPSWVRDMKTRTLARQGVDEIYQKIEKKRVEMEEYTKKTAEDLWYQDLLEFEKAWKTNEKKAVKKAKIVRK